MTRIGNALERFFMALVKSRSGMGALWMVLIAIAALTSNLPGTLVTALAYLLGMVVGVFATVEILARREKGRR